MENSFSMCADCVPEAWFVPRVQNSVKWAHDRKGKQQSLVLPCGSLFAVTAEVHCLNVLRMVVSPRPAHPSRINVVGHDVVVVGERQLTDGTLPVLVGNFAVEQLPHLCFGAEFAVPPGVVRVFDPLHSEAPDPAYLLDQL